MIFATASKGFILVSDLDANTVYAVHKRWFAPGAAYFAANVLGFVGRLDFEFGQLTPVVTGLKNPRGMALVPIPEEDRDTQGDQRKSVCET